MIFFHSSCPLCNGRSSLITSKISVLLLNTVSSPKISLLLLFPNPFLLKREEWFETQKSRLTTSGLSSASRDVETGQWSENSSKKHHKERARFNIKPSTIVCDYFLLSDWGWKVVSLAHFFFWSSSVSISKKWRNWKESIENKGESDATEEIGRWSIKDSKKDDEGTRVRERERGTKGS